jgi:hypothetical protein
MKVVSPWNARTTVRARHAEPQAMRLLSRSRLGALVLGIGKVGAFAVNGGSLTELGQAHPRPEEGGTS